MKIVWILAISLSLNSCAMMYRHICNPEAAELAGYKDVSEGHVDQPGLRKGGVCNEEYSSVSYSKDYAVGRKRALAEFCTPRNAMTLGSSDGAALKDDQPGLKKLSVCIKNSPEGRSLEQAYQKSFNKYFCQPEHAEKWGKEDAKALKPARSLEKFSSCEGSATSIERAYKKKYDHELKQNCKPARIIALALRDAARDVKLFQGLEKISACPQGDSIEFVKLYRDSFTEERERLEEKNQKSAHGTLDPLVPPPSIPPGRFHRNTHWKPKRTGSLRSESGISRSNGLDHKS